MRKTLFSLTLLAVASATALPAFAQAPSCRHSVGMVVSLTGPAGRFGQAASKSVELAFRDLNEAGGPGGCKLAAEIRDAQSQGAVAVDQARQLVDLRKTPVIIGGIISSTLLTLVVLPALYRMFHRDLPLAASIIKATVKAVSVPVTDASSRYIEAPVKPCGASSAWPGTSSVRRRSTSAATRPTS